MTFSASVVRVLIASPGDTVNERDAARRALEDWNSLHAEATGIVLLSQLWERDSTPDLSVSAQRGINGQLVDRCDALIGIFWSRLGTPTEDAESGTAEEIERCVEQGKPVLIYFSDQDLPSDVDPDQLKRLREFTDSMQRRGLVSSFRDPEDLASRISNAMTRLSRERFVGMAGVAGRQPARAALRARVRQVERLRDGFQRLRATTEYRLEIENYGEGVAEDLEFEFHSDEPDVKPPDVLDTRSPVKRLAPGSDVAYSLVVVFGTASQWEVILRWHEGGESREETQTVRL